MKIADVRVPFWVRWLGEWRAFRKAQADRRAHAIYVKTPLLIGIMNGETKWTDMGGFTEISHVWHLYETPSGVRTVEFKKASSLAGSECAHPLYRVIKEWEGGLRDASFDSEGKLGFTRIKIAS